MSQYSYNECLSLSLLRLREESKSSAMRFKIKKDDVVGTVTLPELLRSPYSKHAIGARIQRQGASAIGAKLKGDRIGAKTYLYIHTQYSIQNLVCLNLN